MTTAERWRASWQALGATAVADAPYHELLARYAEPHRHYHTRRHLDECFAAWDSLRAEAEHPGEVEIALWFHDGVYDAHRSDNEARSAALARAAIGAAGLSAPVADRVDALILATRHDALPATADAACVVDADLAILAAPPARFDEYETEVRAEYAWVPGILFRRKRREVLEGFLARANIYSTRLARESLEGRARENLGRSVVALGG